MAPLKHCPCPRPSSSPTVTPVGCCSPRIRPRWMAPASAGAGMWGCLWHNTLSLHGKCVPMETHNISFKFGLFLSAETVIASPPLGCDSLVSWWLWCHHHCWPLVPYCGGLRGPTVCSCTLYLPAAVGKDAGDAMTGVTTTPMLPASRGARGVGMGMHQAHGLRVPLCQLQTSLGSLWYLGICCLHMIPITAAFKGLAAAALCEC